MNFCPTRTTLLCSVLESHLSMRRPDSAKHIFTSSSHFCAAENSLAHLIPLGFHRNETKAGSGGGRSRRAQETHLEEAQFLGLGQPGS